MQAREEAVASLREAVSSITAEADLRLIPGGGIRMGYALPGATTQNEVCAVEGGIEHRDRSFAGTLRFGADPGVAKVILTIVRHDACLRSVASLRCTREILRCVTDDLMLDAALYGLAPPGSDIMDWGVESCCRDGVPDVIYGQGTPENGFVLWLIGENPADVARNIIMLSSCISYTSL